MLLSNNDLNVELALLLLYWVSKGISMSKEKGEREKARGMRKCSLMYVWSKAAKTKGARARLR